MKRTADGVLLIAPASTLPHAATLEGLPDAVVRALQAGAAAASIEAALASGREQRLTAALLALDARLRLSEPSHNPAGPAEVPLDERLTLDGRILPRPAESLRGIVVRTPAQPSTSRESTSDQIGLAAQVGLGSGPEPRILRVRIVWWGLAPAPFIARQVEGVLQGRRPDGALIELAVQTARTEAQPAGAGMELDARRLDVVTALCREVLTTLLPPDPAQPA